MPADSLYINVYKNDGRKSKELYTSNETLYVLLIITLTA